VAAKPLADWARRFEQVDACVTPVLTLEEAQTHALFSGGAAVQPWREVVTG